MHETSTEDDHHVTLSKKPKLKETKPQLYKRLHADVDALLTYERDVIANTANVSSLIFHELNEFAPNSVNWCGFYFMRKAMVKSTSSVATSSAINEHSERELVLGPFQG
jgi:GAF domain-containing protein